MRTVKDRLKQRLRHSSSEDGFTLVEMVIAIPITVLMLGLVFASIGIAVGLMGQVQSSAGASRALNSTMDDLSTAKTCPEIDRMVNQRISTNATQEFEMNFSSYSCLKGKSFPLTIDVKEKGTGKLYLSQTVSLAAM